MLLQKEKQSIEEIGKKDKKIYERRKVSLSNIYDLLFRIRMILLLVAVILESS